MVMKLCSSPSLAASVSKYCAVTSAALRRPQLMSSRRRRMTEAVPPFGGAIAADAAQCWRLAPPSSGGRGREQKPRLRRLLQREGSQAGSARQRELLSRLLRDGITPPMPPLDPTRCAYKRER